MRPSSSKTAPTIKHDDAGGPENADAENETEQEEYESENNHALRLPRRIQRQTSGREHSAGLKAASACFRIAST